MALPSKGDPTRPMRLAIRSMWLIGAMSLLPGTCVLGAVMRGGMIAFTFPEIAVQFVAMLVYIAPGAMFMISAFYLGRRRSWAIVVGIVAASMVLLFCVVSGLSLLPPLLSLPSPEGALAAVAELIVLIFIAAFVQLIYHLSQSFASLRHLLMYEQRGFEPLMVHPISPPEEGGDGGTSFKGGAEGDRTL